MAARRLLKSLTPTFIISSDPTKMRRSDPECLGILWQVFLLCATFFNNIKFAKSENIIINVIKVIKSCSVVYQVT